MRPNHVKLADQVLLMVFQVGVSPLKAVYNQSTRTNFRPRRKLGNSIFYCFTPVAKFVNDFLVNILKIKCSHS